MNSLTNGSQYDERELCHFVHAVRYRCFGIFWREDLFPLVCESLSF